MRLPDPSSPALFPILQQDAALLTAVDAAFTDAVFRAGPHLTCHPGCTQCCHGAFAINPLDALRLRAGMARLSQADPALASAIERRAFRYLAEFAPTFPGDPATGILGASEADQDAFEDFANEAPCPALDPATGLCDLYSARPMTCRVFGPPIRSEIFVDPLSAEDEDPSDETGALSVCELCFTQATPEEIAAAELHIPHDHEQRISEELAALNANSGNKAIHEIAETIVAYCLIPATSSASK